MHGTRPGRQPWLGSPERTGGTGSQTHPVVQTKRPHRHVQQSGRRMGVIAGASSRLGGTGGRVLIVDDHPILREGVAAIIALQTDMAVVGNATDGREAIAQYAALRPDVVLMATSSRASARLESLGVAVVALEPKTHADVQRVLGKIGQVLAVPDAQRVWRRIDAAVEAAAQSVPPAARGARVYFEVNRGPYGAGTSSFIGETLTRLGARNILPAALGPFPKLNPEYVVRADPDLIMVGARSVEGLAERPGWGSLRALREQRLCVFSPEESDVLVRPGPRMAEGARLMAGCLASKAVPAATGAAAGRS